MRFYLSTFMLVILLLATLMAVWARREPWIMDSRAYSSNDIRILFPSFTIDVTRADRNVAPDGRTVSTGSTGDSRVRVATGSGSALLYDSSETALMPLDFIDNDTILTREHTQSERPYRLFLRRHPEWWWGHFYRPEVWASIALFFSLVIHLVRARNQRNAGH
jgi:hypothetical protein